MRQTEVACYFFVQSRQARCLRLKIGDFVWGRIEQPERAPNRGSIDGRISGDRLPAGIQPLAAKA